MLMNSSIKWATVLGNFTNHGGVQNWKNYLEKNKLSKEMKESLKLGSNLYICRKERILKAGIIVGEVLL